MNRQKTVLHGTNVGI